MSFWDKVKQLTQVNEEGVYMNDYEKRIYDIISKYFDPNICGGVTQCTNELLDFFNEELAKEKDQYSQLFENYWDMKKKLNIISDVTYRFENGKKEE